MLFKRETLEGIARGEITLALRRWKRPTVASGSQLRTAAGVLQIGSVEKIAIDKLSLADAHRAGFATLADARESLAGRDGDVYRIELQGLVADPRVELRGKQSIAASEQAVIARLAARLDRKRPGYVSAVLKAIQKSPGAPAADLADAIGVEKPVLKRDIRQLKEHGLTESLSVGYRLSPRGKAWLSIGPA
jgi:DNA-binding transcriptional ArsR family regulator